MSEASIPAALRRRREYSGPALFSYGFRPFFLGGAVWAVLAMVLWLPQFSGELALPTAFNPIDWHIHEMLFGYVAAIIAGFLLTAIPNWTGRLPVNGYPLAALAALWLAGRVAVATSAMTGAGIGAVIDVAFLGTLAAVAVREIVAGQNWRNLRVLIVVGVLIAANIVFHIESTWWGTAQYGVRLGTAAVLCLIMLVGGRIVPSFTRNWLVRVNPGRLPQPFARLDALSLGAGAVALASWTLLPELAVSGALLMAAGLLHGVRLVRWAGDRTLGDRLVFVLHVAYGFVPIGFLLLGASILWPTHWPASAGLHAWTVGAVGLMTLAVMTRASLGHTGQMLVASPTTQVIYLAVLAAAIIRIAAAFVPSIELLHGAAVAWIVAFGGFALFFGPTLIGRPATWAASA